MKELYESGFIFPLEKRDQNGCRVIMIQANKLDTKKFSFSDILRIINLVIFTLLEEHETQIAGFVYVFDHKSISMDYIGLFSLIDIRNYLKCIQNAMPCRQKQGIWVNLPSFAVKLTDLCKNLVSAKLRERAYFYQDMDKVYGHIDPKILPKEHGGQATIKEMMTSFKILADRHKEKLKQTDGQHIDLDRPGKSRNIDTGGSFKTLEIDWIIFDEFCRCLFVEIFILFKSSSQMDVNNKRHALRETSRRIWKPSYKLREYLQRKQKAFAELLPLQ